MIPILRRVSAPGLLLPIVLAACGGPGGPSLAPVPEIDLSTMSEPVRRQIEDALAAFHEEPTDAASNGRLGMLFDAYDRIEARVFYDRARHLDPDNFRWAYLHGMILVRQGERDAAIDALRRALELRPGYPNAELELAGLLANSDVDAAAQLYRQLLERNPTFARAHARYGRFLLERGDTEAAIASLETALGYSNRYGQAHYTLAQAWRELGNDGRAAMHAALFERYRRFRPGLNDPLRAEVAALNISDFRRLERALVLSANGRHAAAARELEALVAGNPGDLSAHVNLIAAYGELGNFEKAREHANLALAIDPQSVEANDNLGILLLKRRDYRGAETAFQTAIALDPDYSVPHRNLGIIDEAGGRLDEAIAHYTRAVALDPFDRQARHALARALLADNRPAEAIDVIEPLTGFSHPETASHLQLLGRAYEKSGDLEAAAATLQRALVMARMSGRNTMAEDLQTRLDRVRDRLGN